MLKKIHSLLICHLQAAKQSLEQLCLNPLGTSMTLIVIAIALALPTLFWVFTDNMSQLSKHWHYSGSVSLYLKTGTSELESQTLLKKIQNTQGVGQATLKSSADALAELIQQEGMEDIMHYLPENPLPSTIEVIPALAVDSPAKLDLLARQLKMFSSVDQVKSDKDWIERFQVILNFAAYLSKALMVLLALAVVFIIANTLSLIIKNEQQDIQILKLIGATDSFILRPFLYAGIWYGFVGTMLAIFFVNLFMLSIGIAIQKVATAYQMSYVPSLLSISQILLLVIFAVILGWLGALLSVKRQLALIEPCM